MLNRSQDGASKAHFKSLRCLGQVTSSLSSPVKIGSSTQQIIQVQLFRDSQEKKDQGQKQLHNRWGLVQDESVEPLV